MSSQDLSGAVLDGRYKVIGPIAEGAMGSVYRGERLKLGRAVAIKIMHEALPDELASRQRFEREAKLMARIEHPHCVQVIDFGLHEERPFLVMELIRGTSLIELLDKVGRIEPGRAVDLVRQVLSGLGHAHELGIVHRDIKPANIMLTEKTGLGEQARILDFGLARPAISESTKLTTGIVVGTPNYMAPEQIKGGEIDGRTDLYACGVMLFEMLTGRKPFVADDPIAVVRKHLNEPPPTLADVMPGNDFGELEAIVARALAKEPAGRFATAAEMSSALEQAIDKHGARKVAELMASAVPYTASAPGAPQVATMSGWNLPINESTAFPSTTLPSGPPGSMTIPSAVAHPGSAPVPMAHVPSSPMPQPMAHVPSSPVPQPMAHVPSSPVPQPMGQLPSSPVPQPMGPIAGRMPTSPVPQPMAHAPSSPVPQPMGQLPPGQIAGRMPTSPVPTEIPNAMGSQPSPFASGPILGPGPGDSQARTSIIEVVKHAIRGPSTDRPIPQLPLTRRQLAVIGGGLLLLIIIIVASRGGGAAAKTPAGANVAASRDAGVDDVVAPALSRASDLYANGDLDSALDVALKARRQRPDNAQLAFLTGKIYFARLYWTDGIKNFRDAIRLDPAYRNDPELMKIALRGFNTTPDTDSRLEEFLREDIGEPIKPLLEDTAQNHANSVVRARAAAELRRIP